MSSTKLWIASEPETISLSDLIWRKEGLSSFHSNLHPNLSYLGNVSPQNRDLLWLAINVFLTDRTHKRKKGWMRNLSITTPVQYLSPWQRAKEEIEGMLSFLTSDNWNSEFIQSDLDESEIERRELPTGDLICLFSGGADSLCGIIHAMNEGHKPILLSHWDWPGHKDIQSRLLTQLNKSLEVEIPHIQVRIGTRSNQLNGIPFPREPSRRSRSFLFITLGLAVASSTPNKTLWIPENGFTSLNPPFAPERRGSLSTRSTHPLFFENLHIILQKVNCHNDFVNPFEDITKGELFLKTSKIIGSDSASQLLSMTHSCSHIRWAIYFGYPPSTHCGVCHGCVIRRAAFKKANLEDQTEYLVDSLTGDRKRQFLNWSSVPMELSDVLALNLPSNRDHHQVLELIKRGFSELSGINIPER